MKRYIRSTQELVPEFHRGDDYQAHKDLIDDLVGRYIDLGGNYALVGNQSDSLYYIISPSTQGDKYQLTEMVDGEPAGHETGDSISKLLEDYFVSHLAIVGG